jgi:hypothetical protein
MSDNQKTESNTERLLQEDETTPIIDNQNSQNYQSPDQNTQVNNQTETNVLPKTPEIEKPKPIYNKNLMINNNRPISPPKVDIKIPDTLTKDKAYEIQRSKPENLINSNNPTKVHDIPPKTTIIPINIPVTSTINIPEANNNQLDAPQNESTIEYLENLKKALRTQSSALKCPFCQKQVETEVTKKCSVINILCAIFTTPIFWACLKCCRGKDCNCYDANHKCKRCRREIADYSAC